MFVEALLVIGRDKAWNPPHNKKVVKTILVVLGLGSTCFGQWFTGGTVGIATLSGDGATKIDGGQTAISLYQPSNGPAFQLFAGKHLKDYLSVQGTYGWNQNRVTFTGLKLANGREDAFDQSRRSRQQSAGVDAMIYFRPRTSRYRPYVSGGLGWIQLSSQARELRVRKGMPEIPQDHFSASKAYWRTAVGMDFRLRPGWQFRYTFWETVSNNTLSAQLRPRGQALFLNFINQFGFVRQF